MRSNRFYLIVSAVLFMGGLAFSTASAGTKSLGVGEKAVVNPGKLVTCGSNFLVENTNGSEASLKVVLGSKVYINEMVNPGERLAYNLPGTIATARFHGQEDLTFDEVAVIINLGPESNLEVSCLKAKSNPLREEDPLKTFK